MKDCGAPSEFWMMAVVNGVIDDLHASLGLAESDFFCECGHTECKERITLTRAEYASLRQAGRPLLGGQHAHRGRGLSARQHDLRIAARASHESGAPAGR